MPDSEIIEYEGRRFVRTGITRSPQIDDWFWSDFFGKPMKATDDDAPYIRRAILRELPAETPYCQQCDGAHPRGEHIQVNLRPAQFFPCGHVVNPETDRCVLCGKNKFQRDAVAETPAPVPGKPETGHTPLPWHYQQEADAYTHILRGPDDQYVVGFSQDASGRAKADAHLTLEAVNSHAALVALLEEAEKTLESIWAGVPDGVRKSLAVGGDNLRSTSIAVIPVLPEVLRKIDDVLARIRASKEERKP